MNETTPVTAGKGPAMPVPESADVAVVLRRIRDEVHVRRQQADAAQGEGKGAGSSAALRRVQEVQQVNPHLPIAWPTWPPGILSKFVAATQKVVRRLLRWYVNPIVAQQNEYNRAVAQVLNETNHRLSALEKLVVAMDTVLRAHEGDQQSLGDASQAHPGDLLGVAARLAELETRMGKLEALFAGHAARSGESAEPIAPDRPPGGQAEAEQAEAEQAEAG
jgi:hypothetical protein